MAQATNPGPLHDLTAFQRDALVVIAGLTRPKGLDIKDRLEQDYGVSKINHSRLYPNLDTLVDLGLLEKGQKDDRTNEYQLTTRGERELEAHQQWTRDRLGGDN